MQNGLSALRLARLQRGLVQTKLARLAGMSASRLSLVERGMAIPSPAEMEALARVLAISEVELFPGERHGKA